MTAGVLLAGALPRLLPLAAGPASLAGYTARYGPPPSGLDQRQRDALIAEVARAGLTGRGGTGFPTARKLAAVAAGHAPVVVANGTEGEPASEKDRVLMASSPHLVLDGAVLAAEITGAAKAVIVVHRSTWPAARPRRCRRCCSAGTSAPGWMRPGRRPGRSPRPGLRTWAPGPGPA
jgi:NADH:ubiquinone oxidoreductase subunit F (NADH-binding)